MKIVIVGGVAGGAAAAARARRLSESAEIVIFERGEYISFANCGLPYHVGEAIPKRGSLLVMTPERFKARATAVEFAQPHVAPLAPAVQKAIERRARLAKRT